MTVILAKFQALLFQSGIGLKIVTNSEQTVREILPLQSCQNSACWEESESVRAYWQTAASEAKHLTEVVWLQAAEYSLIHISSFFSSSIWRSEVFLYQVSGVSYEEYLEVWWWRWSAHYWHSPRLVLPLPVSSDGPNWTFPLQLSPACVSESSKCYTYNLQPTAYSLQPTSSIALATSEEIRRLLLVNNIKYEFSSQI